MRRYDSPSLAQEGGDDEEDVRELEMQSSAPAENRSVLKAEIIFITNDVQI